jgi:hypothetical protein
MAVPLRVVNHGAPLNPRNGAIDEMDFQADIYVFAIQLVVLSEASYPDKRIAIEHQAHPCDPIHVLDRDFGVIVGMPPAGGFTPRQAYQARDLAGAILEHAVGPDYSWPGHARACRDALKQPR